MHLNATWQDASGGSARIDVVLADHPTHSGHDSAIEPHTVELRKRFAISMPATVDEGEEFRVGAVPRTIRTGTAERIWLKVAPLANQIDVIVTVGS